MTKKLDDIQFQKKLQTHPNELDESMKLYLEESPSQMAAVKKAKAFEEELLSALKVPVPEGLQERILVKNSFETQAANDPSWFKPLTLFVASFLVAAVGLGFWLNPLTTVSEQPQIVAQLEQSIIDHIMEHATETQEASEGYADLSDKEVQALFEYVGATLNKPIDFMSYAGGCEVNGQKGLHVVLQEEDGPVTIIVLPGHQLSGIYAFSQDGMKGSMVPVKGAVVAIVGSNEKQLAMAQMHFFKAVSFQS